MAPIRCLSPHKCVGPTVLIPEMIGRIPRQYIPVEGGTSSSKTDRDSPRSQEELFFFTPSFKAHFSTSAFCATRVSLRSEVLHQKLPPLNRKRVCLVPCFNPIRPPSKPRHRRAVLGSLTLAYHNAAENFATCSPHRHHRSAYRCCTWSNRLKLI